MPWPLVGSIWAVPDSITQVDGPHAGTIDAGHLPRGAVHLPCSQRKALVPGHSPFSSLFGVPSLTHPQVPISQLEAGLVKEGRQTGGGPQDGSLGRGRLVDWSPG